MFLHTKMMTAFNQRCLTCEWLLLTKMWGGWGNQQGLFRQKATWRHKGDKKCAPKAREECPPGRVIPQRGMVKRQQTSRKGAGSGSMLPLSSHPQLSSPPLANPVRTLEDTVCTTARPRGGQRTDLGKGRREEPSYFPITQQKIWKVISHCWQVVGSSKSQKIYQ